jgi:hypothetical protein
VSCVMSCSATDATVAAPTSPNRIVPICFGRIAPLGPKSKRLAAGSREDRACQGIAAADQGRATGRNGFLPQATQPFLDFEHSRSAARRRIVACSSQRHNTLAGLIDRFACLGLCGRRGRIAPRESSGCTDASFPIGAGRKR